MKVIQVLPELNAGGVERGTLELAWYLVDRGDESIVVSNGGRLVERLEKQGSRHIELPVHRKSIRSLAVVSHFQALLKDEKPDILHVRSRVPAWIAWLALRALPEEERPHLVTTVHGFYSVNIYSSVMTRGERVICVSESVKRYVLKNYSKVDAAKLRVVHRGVDPVQIPYGYQPDLSWKTCWFEKFPMLRGQFVVCLPGRVTRWKGQLDFLKVVARLHDRGLPVHGLILGAVHPRKKHFQKELEKEVARLGLEQIIHFLGHRADVREIMAVSDVVVSCSTDPEAFGRVTLEALALGRMVAGYDHGGVAEQLGALLPQGRVAVGDIDAMARLLEEWYRQPSKPKLDNPFTLESMLKGIGAVYDALVKG